MTRPQASAWAGSHRGLVWPLYPYHVVQVDGVSLTDPVGQATLEVGAEGTEWTPTQLH